MMMIITYNELDHVARLSLISRLHTMRESLSTAARAAKLNSKARKAKVKKPIHFKSKELEALFHTMSPECQKLLQ